MKKVDYFYNEQGDYTITINDKPVGFVTSLSDAEAATRMQVPEADDEHAIGDYVDVILNFMPDGESPDNFLTAGKVIKRHYDSENSDPCSYDLEFTVEINHEKRLRSTTRIYNVDAKFCRKRDKVYTMRSAGLQIANLQAGRRKDKIEDDHTLNDIIFEAYSEDRKFVAEGHDLWVLGSITGQEVEGEMKWGWIWQVFSQKNEQVFKYTINMSDERLSKSSGDVVDYLNECFKEMVEMVKHDIRKGIIKI